MTMDSEADRKLVARLRGALQSLKTERSGWERYWLDVKRYFSPGRGRQITGINSGEANAGWSDEHFRLNGEASRALDILASGIQSGLTSKSRQWFQLENPDPVIGSDHDVRVWYGEVQEVLENIFRASNIYSAFLDCYYEMAAFGQACISIQSHPSKVISARCHTCGTYYLSSNSLQEIDTVFYTEWMTAEQMIERYGRDACGDAVVRLAERNIKDEKIEVVCCVTRRPEAYGIPVRSPRLPVGSCHFVGGASRVGAVSSAGGILKIGGFRSFPFFTPRWSTIDNDVYGWAPTRDIMGDVKMLQRMESDKLKGLGKIVSPPMRMPPSLERRGLNMERAAVNIVSEMSADAVAPLYTVGMEIQQLQQAIEMTKQSIKDGLYNGLFLALLMQDNPQMTATEVNARQSEKLLMLGPVLERIHYELLDPLIVRVYQMAEEAGMIPPPPERLRGSETQIEYVSILSQAQKAVGVARIEQSLQFLGGLVQMAPEVRHLVDFYKLYKKYNRQIGVREDVFRSEEEYNKIVAQEQEAATQQQQVQNLEPLARSAEALSKIDNADVGSLLGGGVAGSL